MSYFEFPHTRNYDGDLGYIIKKVEELNNNYNQFFDLNKITFNDPLNWVITDDYKANVIVYDPITEGYYISRQPVPVGIEITNSDYWVLIIPFKIETAFNSESLNPVANKTITNKFNAIDNNISSLETGLSSEINTRSAQASIFENQISENSTAIENETLARQAAISAANARIDEIANLPEGSTSGDAELADIRIGYNGKTYANAGDAVRGQIEEVLDFFDGVEFSKRINVTPTYNTGYVSKNGSVSGNATYQYTQKIDVKPGDVIKPVKLNGSVVPKIRFVCAYSNNVVVSSAGSDNEARSYTVPDDIDAVIITVYAVENPEVIAIFRPTTEYFTKNVKSKKLGFFNGSDSLSDGESIELPYENIKNDIVVTFNARITSFSAIKIGRQATPYLTINDTNIIINDVANTYTVAHGLTIANDIGVILKFGNSQHLGSISVFSNGERFDYTNGSVFSENASNPYKVISDGSTLYNCSFSLTSQDINNKLWIFGDSYLGFEPSRWAYYLIQDGYTNNMINAYSGENSVNALIALKNLLAVRIPDNVLWCMGMNDPDSNSAVSANWKNSYDELLDLSKEYGFNIILATIPITPTQKNAFKNAIVKASGYQFIDFAGAVNVGDTSSWISGYLDADNVHPTIKGAKALYIRALTDCPQLTSK